MSLPPFLLLAVCLTGCTADLIEDLINLNGFFSRGSSSDIPLPRDFLEADRLIGREGYQFERYQAFTQDGYILELQRLISPSSGSRRGIPVFFMHGFVAVSDTFIARGRNYDLAFMLADFGYDVWLGNARGSAYSKGHKWLTRSNPAYWDFSIHEISVYDLPAHIDRILDLTGHSQLFYVGYSMSTALFLVMTSMRPDYSDKIILSLLMAPVASEQSDLVSPLIRTVVNNNFLIRDSLKQMNVTEILPRTAITVTFLRSVCSENLIQPFCLYFFGLLVGQHASNLDLGTLGEQAAHYVAGSSIDVFYQITEIIKNGLKPLNYGPEVNLIKYNDTQPPEYNLQRVTCPTVIFYSDNDSVSTVKGAFRLARQLPNLKFMKRMPRGYSHADYVFGIDIVREVNIPVINLFNYYSNIKQLN